MSAFYSDPGSNSAEVSFQFLVLIQNVAWKGKNLRKRKSKNYLFYESVSGGLDGINIKQP